MKALIEKVRATSVGAERIKGKGKGKEVLTRFEGSVVEGESEPLAVDVRKELGREEGRTKRFSSKCLRSEFVEVKYEVRLFVLFVVSNHADLVFGVVLLASRLLGCGE